MRTALALSLILLVGVASADGGESWADHARRGMKLAGEDWAAAAPDALRAAVVEFRKAEDAARGAGLAKETIKVLRWQIECHGLLNDVFPFLDTELRLYEALGALGESARLERLIELVTIGQLQSETGNPVRAHQSLREAVDGLVAVGPEAAEMLASARVRYADCCRVLYRLGDAVREGEAALETYLSIDDPIGRIEATLVLVNIHMELRNFDRAEQLVKEGGRLLDGGYESLRPDFTNLRANIAQLRGRPGAAMRQYVEAIRMFREQGAMVRAARLVPFCARLELDADRPATAALLCLLAEEMAPDDRVVARAARFVRVEAALGAEDLDRAESLIAEALDDPLIPAEPVWVAEWESRHAEVCLRRKNPTAAIPHLRRAIKCSAWAVNGLSAMTGATIQAEDQRELFDRAVRAAFAQSDDAVAFELLERTRAIGLLASIGGGRSLTSTDPEAEKKIVLARRRIAEAKEALDRVRTSKTRKRSAVRGATGEWKKAQDDYRALCDRYGHGVLRRSGKVISLEKARKELPEGRVFVHYAFAGGRLRALLVSGAEVRRLKDLGSADAVTKEIADCRAAIEADEPGDPGAALRKRLVDPLGLGEGIDRVYVSPDGPIAMMPAAVVFPEHVSVVFVPSATVLDLLAANEDERGSDVLALGDPAYTKEEGAARDALLGGAPLEDLDASRDEVEAIANAKDDVRLLGADATETNFRRHVGARKRWGSVHFATHGHVDRRRPGWSALVLTPEKAEDGLLSVTEITSLSIPADLAVLSACHTGEGKDLAGEGLIALPGAFMQAGARCVLASLWKVDDEPTREMMDEFYRHWRTGDRPNASAALKAAQAHVKKKYGHSRHWAAWVLWGLPD